MFLFSLTVLFCVLVGGTRSTIVTSSFDESIPGSARGFTSGNVTIPCRIREGQPNHTVSWITPPLLHLDSNKEMNKISVNQDNNTWSLTILNLSVMANGEYICRLHLPCNTTRERSYHLSVLDYPENYHWDSSRICGFSHTIHGQRAICDARGTYPCCNSNGKCGYSSEDCRCSSCVDFRNYLVNPKMKAELIHQMNNFKDFIQEKLGDLEAKMALQMRELSNVVNNQTSRISQLQSISITDCRKAKLAGHKTGVTNIYLTLGINKNVYCDQDTDGGGWLVIIRRMKQEDDQLSFDKGWRYYVQGFGNPEQEYWVGLTALHALTGAKNHELMVKMRRHNESAVAFYDNFSVGDASSKYTLHIGGFDANRSSVGDSLTYHDGRKFSTSDMDNNDISGLNCARKYAGGGGWWYNRCSFINPTGLHGGHVSSGLSTDGYFHWYHWKNTHTSNYLTDLELLIRPKN